MGQATQCLRESVYSEYLVDARIVARKHVEIRKADTITRGVFHSDFQQYGGCRPGKVSAEIHALRFETGNCLV